MQDALQQLLAGIAGVLNEMPEYRSRFVVDSPEVVALAAGFLDSLPDLIEAHQDQFGVVKLRFERGRVAFVNYERSRKTRFAPRAAGTAEDGGAVAKSPAPRPVSHPR